MALILLEVDRDLLYEINKNVKAIMDKIDALKRVKTKKKFKKSKQKCDTDTN